jgi:hypothetical protein
VRRESSTVIVVTGQASHESLAGLARSPNVSVTRGAAPSGDDPAARPAWETGARAMREAARRNSTYVIVLDDPLADVAAAWSAMWDVSAGPDAAVGFEQQAADALAAWCGKRFELPDYYLVLAPAQPAAPVPDLYLGPLRAVRPRRVAVATGAGTTGAGTTGPGTPGAQATLLLDTLRSLEHGPWWPPLDELLDAARRFYPGSLAETQPTATQPTATPPTETQPPG